MSFDYSTYVGPYARAVTQPAQRAIDILHCTNPRCRNHGRNIGGAKFCPACGSLIAEGERYEQSTAVDAWHVQELIDEALATPGGDDYHDWAVKEATHIWLPNKGFMNREPHLESQEAWNLSPVDPRDVQSEILAFQVAFEAAINTLRSLYGADKVTIHWGIVQYYY